MKLSTIRLAYGILDKKRTPKLALVGGPDVDGRIELMQYLRNNFQVFAIGSEPALVECFAQAGFRYRHYHLARRVNPMADFRTLAELLRIFRQERPHIIHAFDTKPCVFARFAARLAGVPVIVGTLPGLGSLYVGDGITTRIVRAVYERLQSLACRVSDLTIFQNHDDARQFVDRGLVPAHKTTVIPGSGVRMDVFCREAVRDTDIQRLKTELGLSQNHTVITMISRLIRSKGVLEFAEAARIVRRHHQDVRFLLVGPDDRDSVDRLSPNELESLSQSVTWLGERQDIPVILALSDIFALPSFYREGIPRVLLEAASMGLPIVTTDSPGCSEVVEHGANGFLVPARDPDALAQAIVHLIEDPEMRERFGQESRQHAVAHFDLSRIAGHIRAIYRELLAHKGLLPAREA